MALKVFNSLTRALDSFVPCDPAGKGVSVYCCGPTVHDYAHIGNFRTFVFADLLRRYLRFKEFSVKYVMNVTDVEDKIIARVRAANLSLRDYTARYERAFFDDLERLQCQPPDLVPRATENIAAMIKLIEALVVRGLAYQAADGSVYFSIAKFQEAGGRYGQLVKLNFEEMRPGDRVRSDEYAKESVADFALWKARVPDDGPVFWPSPWGEGRPGWHIECSAMSMALLGASFDLHLGGEDLIFPHHEDEIAQSEGSRWQMPGRPFVKYWLHVAHLMVEGKKMSKSLGNFFTLRDLIDKGFGGREIRFCLLSAHYRESFNFTLDGLAGARTALARIDECLAKLSEAAAGASGPPERTVLLQVETALDDDFNVSSAWAAVFDWVRELNRALAEGKIAGNQAAAALAEWKNLDAIFGLGDPPRTEVPAPMLALLERRQVARSARDFKTADAVRDELKAAGWLIEDTPAGPKLRRG